MKAVPLIGIARHRLTIDGEGVTTLVAFHGCPLRCKYCLNPTSLQPDGVWESYDCNQLYEEVRKDELYFLASSVVVPIFVAGAYIQQAPGGITGLLMTIIMNSFLFRKSQFPSATS